MIEDPVALNGASDAPDMPLVGAASDGSDGNSDDDGSGGSDGGSGRRRRRANRANRANRGSRRRLRQAAGVVTVAVLAGAGGVYAGTRLKSPADAAAERAAPTASLITVPVELRRLVSTLAVQGEIRYVEPTPVRLAGAVGTSAGDRQVVTRLPDLDTELLEGGLLLEISGRPVFAMRGELPMYRQLTPGSKGPDVLQLETALQTLGFAPGTVDDLYDAGTEAALDAFYQSRGYASEGASDTERASLATSRKAVADAEDELRKANVALSTGSRTVSASDLLAAQQEVGRAEAAVPEARETADRNNAQAAQASVTATALRDNARSRRDAQQVIYSAAAAADAINPATGEPYTAAELAEIQQQLLDDDQALIQAEQELARVLAEQQRVADDGADAVGAALDSLALARARLNDLQKPADTSTLAEAVTAAEQRLTEAQAALAELEAEIGTIVPAGEIVFLPTLPTSITFVAAQLGAPPPTDTVAQVSSTDTEIVGRVSRTDAELITTGTPVTIEVRDFGIETTGVLTEVRPPSQTADPNSGDFGGGFPNQDSGDTSGRLEVLVVADDTSQIRDYIGFPVRITVTISSTAEEVLTVPVAALSVGPDGTSRVEVEVERGRGTRPSVTEMVEVRVGLAAQGYAEILPIDGSLTAGDRVVVGTDTGERQNRRQRASERATTDESSG